MQCSDDRQPDPLHPVTALSVVMVGGGVAARGGISRGRRPGGILLPLLETAIDNVCEGIRVASR